MHTRRAAVDRFRRVAPLCVLVAYLLAGCGSTDTFESRAMSIPEPRRRVVLGNSHSAGADTWVSLALQDAVNTARWGFGTADYPAFPDLWVPELGPDVEGWILLSSVPALDEDATNAYAAELTEIVDTIEANGGRVAILHSPTIRVGLMSAEDADVLNLRIARMSDDEARLCAERAAVRCVLDLGTVIDDRALYQSDGIHLTPDGQVAIAQAILEARAR